MTTSKKVVVEMVKDRDTKNKIRFAEDGGEELGTLYVPKETLKKLGNLNGEKNLTVTLEVS